MTSDLMRTCCRCGAEKLHALFSKDRRKPFGISYACRDCDAIRHKRYGSQPHVYQKMLERAKSAKPDPVKNKARKSMRDAVRRGKLMKPEICEDCGEKSAIIHGHHEDYSTPLSVNWLCPKCHKLRHRIKEGTALAPAEQEGESDTGSEMTWRDLVQEAIDLLTERKHGNPARSPGHNARLVLQEALAATVPLAPTHPGGDSRVVAWRWRSKGVVHFTADAPPARMPVVACEPLVPLSSLEAVERELRDWQNGHANSVRAHAAAITRAETAEASLAAAEGKVTALSDLLVRAQLNVSEIYQSWHADARAALAGSNGNGQ